ncbi:MAG: DUF4238 domain-containing protein [Clostridiales bacterium]|nr:DUF4238 domain-containing protein [Clostridiales bacterium]
MEVIQLDHKYHHYVPQMYLRAFSQNNKSIGGYILSENKYVNNMSIAGICGRKYLYGEDLEVERWFSDLESIWSSIIRKIISSESLELSPDEWTYLYMFIYLSEARTSMAADRLDDIVTKTYKIAALTARNHGKLEMTDDRIRQLQVRGDKPNLPLLKAFPKGIEVIEDLIPVLLINHTSREFITSDNPVLRYNYLFIMRNYLSNYGLGHVGIQLFYPLNPILCLMLYDGGVYNLKSENGKKIINAPDQIIELNKLFARNARNLVLFQNTTKEWIIDKYTKGIKTSVERDPNCILENEIGEFMIAYSFPSVRYKAKLSFCEINRMAYLYPFPRHAAGPLRPGIEDKLDSFAIPRENSRIICSNFVRNDSWD